MALADFVPSAWLVAVTWRFAVAGKSAGAVYTPAAVIVPSVAFPPGTPFTLQVTAVLLLFATVAVKDCALPSKSVALEGVTVTVIAGVGVGVGDGAGKDGDPGVWNREVTPAQPNMLTIVASMPRAMRTAPSAKCSAAPGAILDVSVVATTCRSCGKGRMPRLQQANNQRKPWIKVL